MNTHPKVYNEINEELNTVVLNKHEVKNKVRLQDLDYEKTEVLVQIYVITHTHANRHTSMHTHKYTHKRMSAQVLAHTYTEH